LGFSFFFLVAAMDLFFLVVTLGFSFFFCFGRGLGIFFIFLVAAFALYVVAALTFFFLFFGRCGEFFFVRARIPFCWEILVLVLRETPSAGV
jgi:hypothetical protein